MSFWFSLSSLKKKIDTSGYENPLNDFFSPDYLIPFFGKKKLKYIFIVDSARDMPVDSAF